MSRTFLGAALATALLVVGSAAGAATIVDTGTPVSNGESFTGITFRGGIFTLSRTTRITGFERYLLPRAEGEALFRIFSNNPNDIEAGQDMPGDPIDGLSATFQIPARGSPEGWYGVDGLDWLLGPGTYWMVTSSDIAFWRAPFCGADDTACLADPLALEAVYTDPPLDEDTGIDPPLGWYPAGARTGWRLYGENVPEPGTLALLGLGLAGLGVMRRRRAH